MTKNVTPWKLLSSTPALKEKWFPVRKDTVQLPSGRIVDDYFVWESPHIVKTIPVTKDGRFVLCRQYRHALGLIMTQFPAGALDKNETLEQGAQREMEEETGYISKEFIHLGAFAPYATKMTTVVDIFLALNSEPTGKMHYDDQEESEVVLMTAGEVWELIEKKQPHSMSMVAAFTLADRYLRRSAK